MFLAANVSQIAIQESEIYTNRISFFLNTRKKVAFTSKAAFTPGQHVARPHVARNMLLVAGNMLLQACCTASLLCNILSNWAAEAEQIRVCYPSTGTLMESFVDSI